MPRGIKFWMNDKESIKRYLLNRSKITEDGCWLYTGSLDDKGYGRIMLNRVSYRTSRLSAYAYLGLNILDENEHALHKITCKNRSCFNPDHLYIGTHQDNMNDRVSENTYPCGHPRTLENSYFFGSIKGCKIWYKGKN